jgi:retinaldehyde-binding protein 1
MDIYSLLNTNCETLLQQYSSNLETVLSLQATLINDILPDIQHDLELDDAATLWAKEWLLDTCAS